MNVYVFKTSVSPNDFSIVNEKLRSLIPKSKWNFDFEDSDNILRIESKENIVDLVRFHLLIDGYTCEELV